MSELIQKNDNRATIRWKLLTGVSALALTTYVAAADAANADDAARPAIWIELGGQMEQLQGTSSTFTAPFMTAISPTPEVYEDDIFTRNQRPPRYAFGGDGKITFQPEDSNWQFSVGIRYGRSHSKQHTHHQSKGLIRPVGTYYFTASGARKFPSNYMTTLSTQAFADVKGPVSEHHAILDFSAGKDVGIGLFGHDATSTVSAGVRLLEFSQSSNVTIYARPQIGVVNKLKYPVYYPHATFVGYTLAGSTQRSFKGIGPSLSWNASAAIAGDPQDSELMIDWGINAALLFGRQKSKTDHATRSTQLAAYPTNFGKYSLTQVSGYNRGPHPHTRSRRVAAPNIGGFAGLSLKWPNAKLSLGYRYDTFLNAMDIGIDARKTSDLTFQGPYASISIGLGD